MADKVIVAASLQVDGSQAAKQMNDVNEKFTQGSDNVKTFKQQLKDLTNEQSKAIQQYGEQSKEAVALSKKIGELKNTMADAKAQTDAFNTDGSAGLKAFGAALGGVVQGYAAVTGAAALLGVENENVQRTMVKLQAALNLSQGLSNLSEIKKSFQDFGAIVKGTTAYQTIYNYVMNGTATATVEATAAIEAQTVAVAEETAATEAATAATFTLGAALRAALVATGVGLLVLGIIALVNALNQSNDAAELAKKRQKDLNDVMDEGNKGYEEAFTQITKLKQEFKEAAGNNALQKKALEDFNNTVGDSTKQMQSFNDAQAWLADTTNTNAYIQQALARATATAAIGKAAQANLEIQQQAETIDKEQAKIQGGTRYGQLAQDAIFFLKQGGDIKSVMDKLRQAFSYAAAAGDDAAKNSIADIENYAQAFAQANTTLNDFNKLATDNANKADQIGKEKGFGTATKYQNSVLEDAIKEGLDMQLGAIDQQEKLALNEATRLMANEQQKFDIQVSYQMKRIDALKGYLNKVSGLSGDAAKDAEKQLKGAQNQLALMQDAYFTGTINTLNLKVAEYVKKIANEDPGSKAPETTPEEDRQARQQQQYNYHLYGVNSGQDVAPGYSGAANDTKAAIDRAGKNAETTAKGKDDYNKAFDELKKQGENLTLDTSSPGGFVASLANNLTALSTYFAKAKDLAKQGYGDLATVENAAADAKLNLWLTVGKTLLSAAADALGKQTAVGKTAAIAATTIDTYQSATAAYKAMVGIPIVGPVLAPIAAGAAVLAGVANVNKILAVKTPGGDSGGSTPAISGASVAAPLAPTLTQTSTTLPQDQLNQIGNAAAGIVRAYIVNGDVNNNQQQTARTARQARITGG